MTRKWNTLISLLLCTMLLTSCATKESTVTEVVEAVTAPDVLSESASETIEMDISAVENPFIEIETPFAVLQYPSRWEDMVRIVHMEGEPYAVEFYGSVNGREEQHLFDIVFGGDEGFQIGKIAYGDEAISMSMITYDLVIDDSWTDGEVLELRGMREDVQYIISSISQLVAEFESSSFPIETPYATLYYPVIWEDIVRISCIEESPYTLQFSAALENREEKLLFELIFGGDRGDCLGFIHHEGEKIELNIVSHPIMVSDEWTTDELSEIYGMKDDVNYIINALVETGRFQYPQE